MAGRQASEASLAVRAPACRGQCPEASRPAAHNTPVKFLLDRSWQNTRRQIRAPCPSCGPGAPLSPRYPPDVGACQIELYGALHLSARKEDSGLSGCQAGRAVAPPCYRDPPHSVSITPIARPGFGPCTAAARVSVTPCQSVGSTGPQARVY